MKFYKETNFKEDPEIGKIPNNWGIVRLGDKEIAKVIMGQSPPSNTYNEEKKGLPFLQGKLEFGEIYPSPVVYCSNPIKIAEQGDILISVRAPVGDVNLAPYRLCIGRGLAAIRFDSKKANSWFYFYYLQRVKSFLENLGKGSTFKAINKDDLECLKIPLPPLPEQHGVVDVLSAVDLAIQKTDEVIAKTERLKKGLMQTLLTRGIGHKEYKQTSIGTIPKEWDVLALQDFCEVTDGSHWSPKEVEKSNFKIATVANLKETHIDIDSCKSISEADYQRLVNEGDVPEKGDILFSKDGTVGICFAFKQPGNNIGLLSSIAIIKPDHKVLNSEFGAYALKSPNVFWQIIGLKTGTALRRITLEHLKKVKIPIPALSEQERIAEILSTVDGKLELEKNEKKKLERIKQGLMDLLLTGKVRVKVD